MSHTRVLMSASAIALGLMGLAASFLPAELLEWVGVEPVEPARVLLQLMGGLYLGFAFMNWIARGSMIGGIYGRPVAIGNLLHFLAGALALAKFQLAAEFSTLLAAGLTTYVVFAAWFAWLAFGGVGPGSMARTSE